MTIVPAAVLGALFAMPPARAQQDGNVVITDPNTRQSYVVRARNGASFPAAQRAKGVAAQTAKGVAAQTAQNGVLWRDPAEGAFSAVLPAGWRILGGTTRSTWVEPHYVIHAQSPDGGVEMFMDDPRIATRQVPSMYTQRRGWREGQAIPSAWRGKLLLERYMPTPQAAARYAQQALCPNPTMFRGGTIPDQTQSLNREMGQIAQAEGKRVHVDVCEVSFKCGGRDGYVYAITIEADQPGGPVSLWTIYRIAGDMAAPQSASAAGAAMHTLLGSFQMDQAWRVNSQRNFDAIEHANHAIAGGGG